MKTMVLRHLRKANVAFFCSWWLMDSGQPLKNKLSASWNAITSRLLKIKRCKICVLSLVKGSPTEILKGKMSLLRCLIIGNSQWSAWCLDSLKKLLLWKKAAAHQCEYRCDLPGRPATGHRYVSHKPVKKSRYLLSVWVTVGWLCRSKTTITLSVWTSSKTTQAAICRYHQRNLAPHCPSSACHDARGFF